MVFCATVFAAIAGFWVGFLESAAGSLAVLVLCLLARVMVRANLELGESTANSVGQQFGREVQNTSPLPAFVIDEFRAEQDHVDASSAPAPETEGRAFVRTGPKPSRSHQPTVKRG